jgi:biopolymer transport protein ExbB
MFESLNFVQLVVKGGYTIFILIICSVISLAVIIQKLLVFRKIKHMTEDEICEIKSAIERGDIKNAAAAAQNSGTLLGDVLAAGLATNNAEAMKSAIARRISREVLHLEKYLPSIGTIGAITPFIGLLGTVIGIMRAFHDLGRYGVGNPAVISIGIAEALIATAAGLMVAIPSVIFYNMFLRKISRVATEVDNAAMEILSPLIHL